MRRHGPNAEARERTRAALLDAGAELVRNLPVEELLSHVKVRDVAEAAGLTPGAVYHYWPTQERFRRDLLEYMLAPERFRDPDDIRSISGTIREEARRRGGLTMRLIARVGGRAIFEQLRARDRESQFQMSMWARHDDPLVTELLGELYRSLTDDLAPIHEQGVLRSGRTFRPGFDARAMSVVLRALAEGLLLRWAVDPEAVSVTIDDVPLLMGEERDPDEPPWDLFAVAVYFLEACMTEEAPATPGGAGDAGVARAPALQGNGAGKR